MSGPASAPATFYRPAEVAAMLRCSEWWVKEQARNRRIPYAWIGGSYLFTQEHIAEIVHLFEVRPMTETGAAVAATRSARIVASNRNGESSVVRLQARHPRRKRRTAGPDTTAA
jgi:hypothetical protein